MPKIFKEIKPDTPLSPFKSVTYKAALAQAVMSDSSVDELSLINKVISDSNSPLLMTPNGRDLFQRIRGFIEGFLADPVNHQVTNAAYTEKTTHFENRAKERKEFLAACNHFFGAVLEELKGDASFDPAVVLADIEKFEHQHEMMLSDKQYNNIRDSLNELKEYVPDLAQLAYVKSVLSSAIKELLSAILRCDREIEKQQKKAAAPSDPLCLSFAVISDTDENRSFILVAASSPDKNQSFLDALLSYIDTDKDRRDVFELATLPSRDLHKLIHHLASRKNEGNVTIEQARSRNPYRSCAEKSIVATVMKMKSYEGRRLDIDFMCNLAFLPSAALEPAPDVLSFACQGERVGIKIIPPCGDCRHNMRASEVLMKEAPLTSPIRKRKTESEDEQTERATRSRKSINFRK